jgi:hypothetical protein
MDQMIVVVLVIGALCWAVRGIPWKTVPARMRVTQSVSLHRGRNWR